MTMRLQYGSLGGAGLEKHAYMTGPAGDLDSAVTLAPESWARSLSRYKEFAAHDFPDHD